jgi:hypothetical protein
MDVVSGRIARPDVATGQFEERARIISVWLCVKSGSAFPSKKPNRSKHVAFERIHAPRFKF